jgi:hypothetical protein
MQALPRALYLRQSSDLGSPSQLSLGFECAQLEFGLFEALEEKKDVVLHPNLSLQK